MDPLLPILTTTVFTPWCTSASAAARICFSDLVGRPAELAGAETAACERKATAEPST